jgi:hypothetical protein
MQGHRRIEIALRWGRGQMPAEKVRSFMKRKTTILLLGLVLFVSIPVSAHHGNAAFDYDKKVTVSGTVTQWIWSNPHSLLKVDAKDETGEVKHWIIEAGTPADISRQGWSHSSFKPGDEVTVTVIVAKNGQPIGRFTGKDSVILNGKPFPPQ